MPDIFQNINETILRSTSWCTASNAKQDGTYRKLRVELVDAEDSRCASRTRRKAAEVRHYCADGYKAKQEVSKGSCQ